MTEPWIPFSDLIFLPAHKKPVTCLSLNTKASRLATGSMDSVVKLWDFQGLTSSLKSFKQINPLDNHSVRSLCLNKSGQSILIAPGGRHCRLYDDAGDLVMQTIGGDMYLRDPSMAKGHTFTVVGCAWDHVNPDNFITASMDSTVRMWDTQARTFGLDRDAEGVGVWKVTDTRGAINRNCQGLCMSALPLQSVTAKCVAVGCSDGSVQIVNTSKKSGMKADIILRNAQLGHKGEVTGLAGCPWGSGGRRLFSRGMDGKICIWDLANTKGPVNIIKDIPTQHETANLCVSPCGQFLVAATAEADRNDSKGSSLRFSGDLLVMNASDGHEVRRETLPHAGGIQVAWPGEIDQIFVSLTNGEVLGAYEEPPPHSEAKEEGKEENNLTILDKKRFSRKGLLLSIHVEPKPEEDATVAIGQVWTEEDWNAAGYREGRDGDLRLTREARQKKFARNIEAPGGAFSKWGAGGALATSTNLTEFLISGLSSNDIRSGQEDAQKALQEYAMKMAAEGQEETLIGAAYWNTQPKTILDDTLDEMDEIETALALQQKCPHCGLKMCKCPPSLKSKRQKTIGDNWN